MATPFYVTTPIYYVNDAPHIGHAYTTVAADALSRWRRLWGDDVVFLTGTDEHGLKVQRAAEAQGVSPQEWADRTSERFREAWQLLDITNTDFIRTTEPRHYEAVAQFLQKVYDNGYIELDTYEGLYCVHCEAYYAEDELINGGNCPIHDRPVDHVTEENYFFRLSRFTDRLLEHYAQHPEAVQPESRRNEVLGFIKQGLRDFSMSRTSITWGIPLPWDPAHVTYVWFDALFNYCTAIGYGSDRERFDRYWPVDYHLVGKDILRFHAVFWPAMLMAAGEAPPECVFAHGYLLVGGEKMSKTRLNQIAPADLVADFGSDGFRYHFLADQRFGPDGDFSYESMVARYNADLANNFGNLANRVLNMAVNYCGGVVPGTRADGPLAEAAARAFDGAVAAMDLLDYAAAYGAVWDLIRATNAYIEDQEPWKLHKAGEAPPQCVFAHGYLLVGGEKMSKTRLNQIAPADLVADFGSDGFRYHFLADQRFGPDGDFSYEAMAARYNADLANNFGNLANRVLNMAVNYCGGVVPDTRADGPLADAAARAFAGCTASMAQLDYASAYGAVWDLIRATNSYIEDQEPWKLHKAGEAAQVAAVLGDCLEALRIVALLASPVIPRASAELWRRLGLPGAPEDQRLPEAADWGRLPAGSPLVKGDPLFPRFEAPEA